MQSIDLLARSPNGFSYSQCSEILGKVTPQELASVDFLLGFNTRKTHAAAKSLATAIMDQKKGEIVAHDICHKSHNALCRPVVYVAFVIHKYFKVPPTVGKYGTAFSVVFAEAYMATNPVAGVPHFIWDGACWTFHGLGVVPIADAVFRFIRGEV